MILRARIRRPFVLSPMNPGVVVIDVIPTLPVGSLGALGIQKLGELGVCHRRSVEEKFSDVDLMLRPLILRTVAIAHEKYSTRDANHLASVL
jgi:hypothetical protein